MNDDHRVADFVAVDAATVTHAAGRMLDAARDLAEDVRAPLSALDIDTGACGTLAAAGALTAGHQDSVDLVGDLLDRLGAILEGDGDRLYRVAARVSWADTTAAERFGARP